MKRGWALVFSVCACSASSVTVTEVPPQELPPSPQPTAQTVMVEVAPATPMHSGEQWVGTYECAQGQTDLALHIDMVTPRSVDAIFEFSHAPSGAAGAYKVHGSVDASGNVRLVPGPWLNRPQGYVSVGMSGRVREDAFTGRIDHPTCGSFSLQRR